MLTITTSKDEITPDLRRLLKLAQDDSGLRAVMGRAGANVLRKHFRARNATPNKLGGKRTNFWSRVAESVHAPRSAGSKIVIPINHNAISLKVFGGTIRPTKWKNLAIPIHPSVHGVTARSIFDQLFYVLTKGGTKLFLRKSDGLPLYVLKKSTHHEPDPQALPEPSKFEQPLTKAAEILFSRR